MIVLRRIWTTWKRVGQFIGDTIARVVLTIFYFTVFVPFGLGVRLFGDPLGIRGKPGAAWLERSPRGDDTAGARRLS
jgi:hypothetical protein